jgi:predicted PurR-regulated permease PerM
MTERKSRGHDYRGEIVFAFSLAGAGYLAWLLRDVLVLLTVSALCAVVLRPLVRMVGHVRIGRWKPFHGKAILVLLLAVTGGLTAFGFLAFPPVIHDLEQLSDTAPSKIPELIGKIHSAPILDRLDAGEMMAKAQGFASQAATYTLHSMKSLASKLIDLITGFVLTLYFILEGDYAYAWFLSFFPPQRRKRLDETLRRASVRMGRWLFGQLSLMAIFAATSTIVFLCLHLRYAYALGLLTGMLNIIPVLGDVVSLCLALLVAALGSWERVLGVAIFFAIYLQFSNSYLVPRIMRSRVDLPSLAIFVALLIGFSLEGVAGALVAIPMAVLVAVLIEEYLVRKDELPEPETKSGA